MKALWVLSVLSLLLGLGMLFGSYSRYTSTREFIAGASAVEGEIVRLDRRYSTDADGHRSSSYYPVVQYTTPTGESVEFIGAFGSNPASYVVGEKVEILYSASTPSDGRINSFWSLWFRTILFGVLGVVFGSMGFFGTKYFVTTAARRNWLQKNGQRVEARVSEITINRNVKVNGRCPWVIKAEWKNPMSGEQHVFKSDLLFEDPSGRLPQGATVPVLIDIRDPDHHHMELAELGFK